jgi:hypothetical protein
MGQQWIPAEGNPAVRQSLETVRAVTALSGLRAVLALDLLAAFVDTPMSSLDTGLRNGPVAASEVERVVQGSYVGYRHPDAAWTTLPSPVAAAGPGVVFARWFADWLDQADPQRRDRGDARATAKAVAAAARAAGKTALADRIDGVYRGKNGKRKPAPPLGDDEKGESAAAASAAAMAVVPAGRRAASRLPARTTAGILAGTAVLLAGAVAGVAMLSEGGAAANGVRSGALGTTSAGAEGTTGPVGSPSAGAGAAAAPTRSVSAAASAGAGGQVSNSAGAGSTGQLPVAFVSGGAAHSTAANAVNSKANTSAGSSSGGGSGAGGTVATSAPGTTSTTAGSATSSSAAPATSTSAVTDPSTSAAATATASNQGCLNLLGLVTVCL